LHRIAVDGAESFTFDFSGEFFYLTNDYFHSVCEGVIIAELSDDFNLKKVGEFQFDHIFWYTKVPLNIYY